MQYPRRPLVAALLFAVACRGAATQTESTVPTSPTPPDLATPTAPADAVARFAADCRAGLEEARRILPEVVAAAAVRSLDNTALPYNRLLIALERTTATASVMRSVHPDPAIRHAAETCEQEAESFLTDLMLDRRVYDAFSAIDLAAADPESRRMVERVRRDYRRAGVDKDEASRTRLKQIGDELVKLGQEFSKNIIEDVRSIRLTDVAELKGLPQDYIDGHRPDDTGAITITTNYPDYTPFMTYAESNARRRELYVASRSRGDQKNERALRQILALRREKSSLLGYPSWADYATEDKMMKSADQAASFIERVVKTASKRAKADYAELLRYKKKLIDPKATRVEDWEKSWLENKVKADAYQFDAQVVRPYFPYAQVKQGLLDITAELYGVEYVPAAGVTLWHADVEAYEVMQGGKKIGRIFLDMHPREGKYQHAAQFTLRTGVKDVQLPEGVLVCNFPSPSADGAGLMEHDDVETMFHEFGHLMHHVLGGDQRWFTQSGVATEWDFVEAPSHMFEEWAWSHDSLRRFARHVETGEVIAPALVDKMRRAAKFGIGLQTVQQMFYASISLGFHRAEPATLDMRGEVKRLQETLTPFAFVEGTSFHTTFGHLEGYSALYYTYMWSLVIAKDLLTPFKQDGLMNRDWATRYRDRVLAPGGSKDAAELVKDFLGREFNFKAFEDYLQR
jgi:thimet oligopeptidase